VKPLVSKITIAYGTETGNSKKIATQLATKAKKLKINAKVIGLDQYKPTELSKEEYFFTIISTHGDGEPPEAAKRFYEFVHESQAHPLTQLRYSVLALGDSAYPLFCKAGADIDVKLEQLGGTRIVDRQDCDVDYEQDSTDWIESVLQKLISNSSSETPSAPKEKKKTARHNNYKGIIKTSINLNDIGSKKETYHIELTADQEIHYEPGDSAGFVPHNPAQEVAKILELLSAKGNELVTFKDKEYTLLELLSTKINILQLPKRIVKAYAFLEEKEIETTQVFDLSELIQAYPPAKSKARVQDLINILEATTPRLYSIASSPAAHNGEVHLTVARAWYEKDGEKRYGLASNFLAQLNEESAVTFYIQHNNLFRLPADDKDIIMIGPGTGVAPFRAFVAERDSRGAEGRNWLFFGEQHAKTDFLYQSEWQDYLQTGALHRLDLAFSRDTDKKIYVQHRLEQQAAEVFEWLEKGAYLYVCGAKDPMSIDVENTLVKIIAIQGKLDKEKSLEYVERLKEEGRYIKDVY
jgi:sulfite reductase (NADPH) flavoprotein alpha-component